MNLVKKTTRPLSFLSHRNANPKQKTRKPLPSSQAFGPENAECVKPRGVGKRPFEDESDEHEPSSGSFKATSSKLKRGTGTAFGEELSEDESLHSRPVVDKPFGDECSEGESPLSSNDEKAFDVKSTTVFSFGWSSVSTFKKVTFWRERMDDEAAKKQKRVYDNTKRAANANYARSSSKGVYKRNGVDPARLQKLFDAPTCSCALVCI